MNRGRGRSGGYTIVETMIFLAVSAVMFVAVMVLVSGRQGKVEFEQAVRDFESTISDLANDVSTGNPRFLADPAQSRSCHINAAGKLIFDNAADSAPGQSRCIFVGNAIKFTDGSSAYEVYTLAQGMSSTGVASPQVLTSDTKQALYSVEIKKIKYDGSDANAVGFFSTFGSISTVGDGRGIVVDTMRYTGDVTNLDGVTPQGTNKNKMVTLCLESAGSNQHADVSIGGNVGQFRVISVIGDGGCT